MVQADVSTESDPALINQVSYAIAMTNLNNLLMEELVATRRNLGVTRLHLSLGKNPPALTYREARSSGLPLPDPD